MVVNFLSVNGQSNYDLCLKSVGGFDNFIDFLNNNNLPMSSVIPQYGTKIKFNTNDVISKVLSGYNYATYAYNQGLVPLLNNDGTPLLNNDGQPLYNNN